jgi:hypothetical protein
MAVLNAHTRSIAKHQSEHPTLGSLSSARSSRPVAIAIRCSPPLQTRGGTTCYRNRAERTSWHGCALDNSCVNERQNSFSSLTVDSDRRSQERCDTCCLSNARCTAALDCESRCAMPLSSIPMPGALMGDGHVTDDRAQSVREFGNQDVGERVSSSWIRELSSD